MEIVSALPRVGEEAPAMWDIVKPSRHHPRVRRDDQIGAFRELSDGVAHA